jgi:hypothetical protein
MGSDVEKTDEAGTHEWIASLNLEGSYLQVE